MSKFLQNIGLGMANLILSAPYSIRTPFVNSIMSVFSGMLVRSMDYRDNAVKNYAQETISPFPGSYNIGQVCAIYDRVNKEFEYTGGVLIEDIRSAREQILTGMYGDCEDYAVLIGALVGAIGGSARIICALSKDSSHAFPEVYVGSKEKLYAIADFLNKYYGSLEHINVHSDPTNNYWINADRDGYVGGHLYPSTFEVAVYPNGNYIEVFKS